ncbi:MAG: hypothetical protein U0794_21900 [Isosphaeraceae bacterium]
MNAIGPAPSSRVSGGQTILQWMKIVGLLALVFSVPALLRDWYTAALVAGVLACGLAYLGFTFLLESFLGARCPCCGQWSLRRIARYRRYYRCRLCRARFRRYGFFGWVDASGPEDERFFVPQSAARGWQGYAIPEPSTDTMSGRLLTEKRTRPTAPEPSVAPPPAPATRSERTAARLQSIADSAHHST